MTVSLAQLALILFSVAFAYMILAAQVHGGFPPFYRNKPWRFFAKTDPAEKRMIKYMVRFVAGIMALILLSALKGWPLPFLLAGGLSAWAALWLRQDLFRITGGPLPWLTFSWTRRWPMLVFDLWTLGMASGFGLLILAGTLLPRGD